MYAFYLFLNFTVQIFKHDFTFKGDISAPDLSKIDHIHRARGTEETSDNRDNVIVPAQTGLLTSAINLDNEDHEEDTGTKLT